MTATVTAEPLTYERRGECPHSYFADLLTVDRNPEARRRLGRHAEEMRVIRAERERRAWAAIRAGEFEYRVEPNRTDGFGGYFSPPLWMNEYFATARRPGRVLAGLMPRFDLPQGISSVNLPILSTGTKVRRTVDTAAVVDQDIVDTQGSSTVETVAGQADVSLQALEQSPAGAHLDWAILKDLAEDYDTDVETKLLAGRGSAYDELLGVVNVTGATSVTYTSGSPSATAMWTYFGEMAAQLGDGRDLPPECWLMRTARWAWLSTSEDNSNRPLGISSPYFLGSDELTPDPVGGLVSWPVFLDDAIPATLGTGANQDEIICLRPSDLILLEGAPETVVLREPLSGSLGARIQLHARLAAITNRYPSGIFLLGGTGCTVQSGY
jgi:HK97 family phage major capsid protein